MFIKHIHVSDTANWA